MKRNNIFNKYIGKITLLLYKKRANVSKNKFDRNLTVINQPSTSRNEEMQERLETRRPSGEKFQWQTLQVPSKDDESGNLEILHAKALELWQNGRFEEAYITYDRLYQLEINEYGLKDVKTINTNENKAHIMQSMGKLDEALNIFDEVIITRTDLFGRNHKDTISAKLCKAVLLENMDRKEESLLAYEEALDGAKRSYFPEQVEIALRGRGRLLFELQKFFEALKATDEILDCILKTKNENIDSINLRRNRAQCLQMLGETEEAITTYRLVLMLQNGYLGAEHEDTLSTAYSLALLLYSIGEKDESSEIYSALTKAWRTKVNELSATYGELHPFTIEAKQKLSALQNTIFNIKGNNFITTTTINDNSASTHFNY